LGVIVAERRAVIGSLAGSGDTTVRTRREVMQVLDRIEASIAAG
jgi:hypothetical protein